MDIFILYLKAFAAVSIGLLIHTLMKYRTMLALYEKAGEYMSLRKFLFMERVSHAINVLCVCFWLLWIPDLIKLYADIELWIALLSGVVGYANSSLVIKVFGVGNKYILNVIDKKVKDK